jgi:hypothetical protein
MALLACPKPRLSSFRRYGRISGHLGELETEFQPAGALWEGSETTLIAPDLVFKMNVEDRSFDSAPGHPRPVFSDLPSPHSL